MTQDRAFGLVWDLDGTLVDTAENHYMAWRDLMHEHGRDMTYDEFRPTFGLRNDDVLTVYLGFDGDPLTITSLGEHKEELFRASLRRDGIRAQPGARELVEHMHADGVPQAIASSAPSVNIALMLELLGVRDLFTAIVSADEVAHGKPAPDIVLRAAARLALPPQRVVVLEDAPAGVAAGKAAGSKVIAITSTYPATYLAAADLIVPSFTDMRWPATQWDEFLNT